ncbi:MAG: hypothetical protein RBR54_09675 [Sulfurimonas sp.]|jgi:hypothetical protein|nr:hypothetical protein [Sulfurimonas sp.]
MKVKNVVVQSVLVGVLALVSSGCSALQETLASQMEVPTVENQVNRAAIGMAIVRQNNVLAYKMPISADAQWPALTAADINDTQKKFINEALMNEPYFATVHYTKPIQRQMLGSGYLMSQLGDYGHLAAQVLDQTVSPLTYRAVNKLDILFANPELQDEASYTSKERYIADRVKNWPNIFKFDGSLDNYLDFSNGKIREIEAGSSDFYPTIGDAVIALAPVNYKKDLELAHKELLEAYDNVALAESQKGRLETKLKLDEAGKNAEKPEADFVPLSDQEISEINEELAITEKQIEETEVAASEKETIYFELLDQMVLALENDMNIDDENYVKLAKNVNIVADEIDRSATEAYTAFGVAVTNLIINNSLLNFPRELETLAIAKASIPLHLQEKYNERVVRLMKNAIDALPNALIGTYYANKQSTLAGKYSDVTEKIIVAYETKKEQEAEALKAAEEAEQKAQEEAKKVANNN